MKISPRLTRAAASFMIVGMVAAAVPNSGMVSAGACDNGSDNNDFQNACWYAAGVATGVLVVGADRRRHHDDTASNTTAAAARPAADKSWTDLHTFVTN